MILSFGWTADLLPPHGCKDTTRRVWAERTLKSWQKAWDEGRLEHDAVDKCLAYKGKYIGKIFLKERPFLERLIAMPHDEVRREGHPELTTRQFIEKYFVEYKKTWGEEKKAEAYNSILSQEYAVIRFDFTPLSEQPPAPEKQKQLVLFS